MIALPSQLVATGFPVGVLPSRYALNAVRPTQEKPEYEAVRDEKQRNQGSRNEVGSTLDTRIAPNLRAIALVERMQQIRGANKVEAPHQQRAEPIPKSCQREQCQDCG